MKIIVDSMYHISYRYLINYDIDINKLKKKFTYNNPDFHKLRNMGYWIGNTPRILTLVKDNNFDRISLPRGVWSRLVQYLKENGIEDIEVINNTISNTDPLPFKYSTPKEWNLGDDQITASLLAHSKKQGIIIGPCASGKTEILLKAASDINQKTLVIVHTERILSGWLNTASERFGVDKKEIGLLYGKAKREKIFTIGMVRTVLNLIKKDKDFVNRWGCVILDEAHHAPATTFSELINSFPARYRIAATATPKRKDGKEALFYDAFGSKIVNEKVEPNVIYEITDKDLDKSNRIMSVKVVIVPTEFKYDLSRYDEIMKSGFKKLANESKQMLVKRWLRCKGMEDESANTYSDMLDAMSCDEKRKKLILSYLMKDVKKGESCLMLADRRHLCSEIEFWLKKNNIEVGRLMGGVKDSKNQEKTAEKLMTGKLKVAVGTTVADEGMNIPILSRGYGCTPAANNIGRLTQQIGRFKRKYPGKKDAIYYYFWDKNVTSLRKHINMIFESVKKPHSVWYSESINSKIKPLTKSLIRKIKDD